MKALTLHQPWADMVARGHKQYETRSWATNYRGLLAIHSSRSWEFMDRVGNWPFRPIYGVDEVDSGDVYGEISTGSIVAIVKLVECLHAEEVREALREIKHRHPNPRRSLQAAIELELGDFSDGRFAWRLQHVAWLDFGILIRGYQKLWTLPPVIEHMLFCSWPEIFAGAV